MTTSAHPKPTSSPRTTGFQRRLPQTGYILLYAALIPAALASGLGFLGQFHWIFDLFSHFRAQYTLWLALWALIALLMRRRDPAILAVVFTLLNAAPLSYYLPNRAPSTSSPPDLRVITFNLLEDNDSDKKATLAWLEQQDADVVILPELSHKWLPTFKSLDQQFPHSFKNPGYANFGLAIYSKHPLSHKKREQFCSARVPCLTAQIEVKGHSIKLIAIHPLSPVSKKDFTIRNEHLENLSNHISKVSTPVIVAGDFNVSAFSHYFSTFRKSTGLHDAARHRGYRPTYNRYHSFFGIPIDHVLHSPQLESVATRTGPHLGSDHNPLIADFKL